MSGVPESVIRAVMAEFERIMDSAVAYFHDQEPGRWGDHASPARMTRDRQREREEDGR